MHPVLFILAVLAGFGLLLWSADRFVAGASATARHMGVSALIIGMVIVGFGTSAPEIVVSVIAALQGNPGLALGNAYGSNIVNIALILGLTAAISPVTVRSQVLRKELPLLGLVTVAGGLLLLDGHLGRLDAAVLLAGFAALFGWQVAIGRHRHAVDPLARDIREELDPTLMRLQLALVWLAVGLVLLVVSSRILVWGAVGIAEMLGVPDLVIGLTVVAIGTSLPELASSIVAARKNEHDLALGNIIGSNLFNALVVVGVAGAISPVDAPGELIRRDWPVLVVLTAFLMVFGLGLRGRQGRINRLEGTAFVGSYVIYTLWIIASLMGPRP